MKATVSVEGVAELQRALRSIAAGVTKDRPAIEAAAAEPIADRMRADVAVDSGETRDSITVRASDGGAEVLVAGAGLLLEFGTARMPAQPFVRPAIDAEQGKVQQVMAAGVSASIKASA